MHSVAVHVMVVVPIGYGSLTARLSLRAPDTVTLVPVADGLFTATVASPEPDGAAAV